MTVTPTSPDDIDKERVDGRSVEVEDLLARNKVNSLREKTADVCHTLLDKEQLVERIMALSQEETEKEEVLWNYRVSIREYFDIENQTFREALLYLVQSSNRERRQFALDLLYTCLDTLEVWLRSSEDSISKNANAVFYLTYFLQGSHEQQKGCLKIIERAFHKKDFSLWVLRLFGDFLTKRSLVSSELRDLLYEFLEERKLPRSLYRQWGLSTSNDKLSKAVSDNIETILVIEQKEPGCAGVLYREFGIKIFGRYNPDMLVKQYLERDMVDKPYGVVLHPEFDHSGAFYGSRNTFQELSNELEKHGYLVRVAEWSNRKTLVRRLYDFEKRYGKHQKISFGVLGGHGSSEDIRGGAGHEDKLTLDHMMNQRTKRLLDTVLIPEAPIILESCSTGAFQGVAHFLASNSRRKVIGPESDTALRKITPGNKDGKLIFEVQYRDANTCTYPIRGSY